jgi:hypothetical protein
VPTGDIPTRAQFLLFDCVILGLTIALCQAFEIRKPGIFEPEHRPDPLLYSDWGPISACPISILLML